MKLNYDRLYRTIKRKNWLRHYRRRRLRIDNGYIPDEGLPELSEEEKNRIDAVWGQLGYKVNYKQHRFFKKRHGHVDPCMITDDIFSPHVERSLNPYKHMFYASNKSMTSVWYNDMRQPICYVRRVNEQVFFMDVPCLESEAYDMLLTLGIPGVIIKQSVDTYGGISVRKLSFEGKNKEKIISEIKAVTAAIPTDYVIQEIVRQSSDTAFLNKESLNTIRVTSFNINGKLGFAPAMFRTGLNGNIIDNVSLGGMFIGIDEKGVLGSEGFNEQYDFVRYKDSDQVKQISSFAKILENVRKYHPYYFPNFGIIGWDWAINENQEPVFIEANLWYPDIYSTQMLSGKPLFGDRTQEMVDYVKSHPARILNIDL